MTQEEIRSEINALQRALALAKAQASTSGQILAVQLHQLMCQSNHTDGCSWYYELERQNTWAQYNHSRWLVKAQEVLALEPDADKILEVVEILVGKKFRFE